MLKVRVIPTLLYRGFGLVKGVRFDSWRGVGSVLQSIKVYNLREVDEVVFVDIAATEEQRPPDYALVDDIADDCFMPLTVGGGIADVEHVRRLLKVGADKVAINSMGIERPGLVKAVASEFGSQCVVASVDCRPSGSRYEVMTRSGTRETGLDPVDVCRRLEDEGAGELLVTAIHRDGTLEGYDLDLVRAVVDSVSIPVIASGGAGTYEHLIEAVTTGGASAVAAGSMFHFTQATPLEAKRRMRQAGIPVRIPDWQPL